MALANYVYATGRADADQFKDEACGPPPSNVADDLLNRIDDRLWVLLPDLYGPDGDHPRWRSIAGLHREPPALPTGSPIRKLRRPEQPWSISRLSAARRRCRHRGQRGAALRADLRRSAAARKLRGATIILRSDLVAFLEALPLTASAAKARAIAQLAA